MCLSEAEMSFLAHFCKLPQIEAANVYACTVIGYLVYTLAQVFLFCFFGNRLIEEVITKENSFYLPTCSK